MQINLRAIVQSEYGAREKVLQIANRRLDSEQLGTDDVVVRAAFDQFIPTTSRFFQPFRKVAQEGPGLYH
jgi:hypothetical protein